MRVAAVTLNQTPLDWDGNRDNILLGIEDARSAGASIVCTPELSITGYGCEDTFLWPHTATMALRVLEEIRPHTHGLVVCLGLPLAFEGRIYNTVALLVSGELRGLVAKRHLAGEGLHYEPRWFTPWPRGVTRHVSIDGRRIPLGDLVFEVGGVRLGFEICEDAWVEERPGFELARAGASLVLNPSASHFAFGKHSIRRRLVKNGVVQFGVHYVYCNLLGNEAGRAIYDGDALIAVPKQVAGERQALVVAEGRRLSFKARGLIAATLDLVPRALHDSSVSRDVVSCPFAFPASVRDDVVQSKTPGADDEGELPKEEALARVLSLGLFDYMRKTRALGFVVSLSGGADSAAVALLIWIMVRLGIDELEIEEFKRRCGWSGLDGCLDARALANELCWTVYQGTDNSSEVTRVAARGVAEFVGARHHEIDVQALVDTYRRLAESAIDRPLSWETDDLALQNIQARVRAPSVWMLANIGQKLLLSTSNRSEAAVGYATMDGDTAGGLCPIGGVDKAFLRIWLNFMKDRGLLETGPVPALSAVLRQAPTAELRPPERVQSDEADLMPYDVLDVIERSVILKRLVPQEVLEALVVRFPQHDQAELVAWLSKFYRLFSHNQWKRERYAPSFHVDDANLDPKTWCRFPILSGGFRREIAEMSSASDS